MKLMHQTMTSFPLLPTSLIPILGLLLLFTRSTGLQITESTASSRLVPTGSNTTLTCATDSPWFFCLWNSPHNDRHCAIQESTPVSVCSSREEGLQLSGTPHSCTLHVAHASPAHHHGDWLCLLNDIRDFETVRGRVRLDVATPAQVSWQLQSPLAFTRAEDEDSKTIVLSLMEGERANISCLARDALPAPSFAWAESGQALDADVRILFGGREADDEGELSRDTLSSLLEYTARLNHSGSNITCTVEQYHPDDGHLMYSTTILLQLDIAPLVLPLGRAVSDQIGILSGILLAILLVVLLCTLLMVVMIRRDRRRRLKQKKQQKQYDEHNKMEDAESLAPIWRPRGGGLDHNHHHHHHFQFQELDPGDGRKLGQAPGRRDRWGQHRFFIEKRKLHFKKVRSRINVTG